MQTLVDFLTFRCFISAPVMIAFYYLGAVVLPLVAALLARRLLRPEGVAGRLGAAIRRESRTRLSWQRRWLLGLVALFLFLFMELLWRLMFEYLIAYIQIRDALVPACG